MKDFVKEFRENVNEILKEENAATREGGALPPHITKEYNELQAVLMNLINEINEVHEDSRTNAYTAPNSQVSRMKDRLYKAMDVLGGGYANQYDQYGTPRSLYNDLKADGAEF
jgi:hypothetical protein